MIGLSQSRGRRRELLAEKKIQKLPSQRPGGKAPDGLILHSANGYGRRGVAAPREREWSVMSIGRNQDRREIQSLDHQLQRRTWVRLSILLPCRQSSRQLTMRGKLVECEGESYDSPAS